MNVAHKIVIVGGGQLGSRHLQALCLLKESTEIFVCDPNSKALQTCEERAKQMPPNPNINIHYLNDISRIPTTISVAIVATNSKVRANVINELLSRTTITQGLILEKFLFPKISDYNSINQLLVSSQLKTWVNCPRRMFDIYKKIKRMIRLPIKMKVEGNSWGLGSNVIHFIDLFSYFINDSELSIETSRLQRELKESKREGYKEIFGEINAYSNDSHCKIVCNEGDLQIPLITIEFEGYILHINEAKRCIEIQDLSDGSKEITQFEIPFQSGLSNLIVEDIIEHQTCDLVDYSVSSTMHHKLLESLLYNYDMKISESFEIT